MFIVQVWKLFTKKKIKWLKSKEKYM